MNAISDSASRLFDAEFSHLSALVQKRLELEWRYHREPHLSPTHYRLFDYALEFGLLLQVTYRHGLFGPLRDESRWYAAIFTARGQGHDLFAVLLESWIIAIQGSIKPPECHELAGPIKALRDNLSILIAEAQAKQGVTIPRSNPLLVEKLINGDLGGAREVTLSLMKEARSLDQLIVDDLLPAMAEIGRRWEINDLEVFEEHLATETIRNLLAGFPAMVPGTTPKLDRKALVTCAPGDEHELIPLALAAYLDIRGWSVKNLGASLPAGQIARAATAFAPQALFMTLTMLSRLDHALEVIEQVRRRVEECRIVVGGHGALSAKGVLEDRGTLVAGDFEEGHSLALKGQGHA